MVSSPETDQTATIRVLIAADQPIVRCAFTRLLSLQPDMSLVAEAANGAEAVRLARLWQPDIVLIDIQMPRLGGCAMIQRVLAESPGTQVVVLTPSDTDEFVFDAISSGAEAYLLRDASEHEILDAIRAVVRQGSFLAPKAARRLLNEFRRIRPVADKLPNEPLTSREARVLKHVIAGQSNKQIAASVFLAEGTVKNYVSRIMEKLNVRSRTELAVKGLRLPMLTDPASEPIAAEQREQPS